MKWSESTTLQFVKIYLKHECLWNPTHGEYTLNYKREQAYAAIIKEFKDFSGKNMTLLELKTKIKNLRTTYSQEVQKILHKSRPDSIYEPTLVWFQEMDQCLKDVYHKRQSINYNHANEDIPEVDSSSHSLWADKQDQDLHNGSFEDVNPDPLVSQSLADVDYDLGIPDQSFSIVKVEPLLTCNTKKIKKKKLKHKPPQTYAVDSRADLIGKEDEFDIYGKFIATQLRKMELNQAIRIQLAIQNLLSKARISEHS